MPMSDLNSGNYPLQVRKIFPRIGFHNLLNRKHVKTVIFKLRKFKILVHFHKEAITMIHFYFYRNAEYSKNFIAFSVLFYGLYK